MTLKRCPLCKDTIRFKNNSSFIYCQNCKSVINNLYRKTSYDRDYFMDDYEKQYGRTYIDDFQNIYSNALRRLEVISKHSAINNTTSLLDIGSAAGFFLKAAGDMGIGKLLGIEVSAFAADYCRNTFSIPVIQDSFDNITIDEKFDIISSWFFIEHCEDPNYIFKRLYKMLNHGGVLALSMPSCFGPMYLFNRQEWKKTHPSDHMVDISPYAAKSILNEIGFRKVKVIKSGFHPERILDSSSVFYSIFSKLYRIYTDISAFSDTIEVYAIK